MKKIILVLVSTLLSSFSYSQSINWTLAETRDALDSAKVEYRFEYMNDNIWFLVTEITDESYEVYAFEEQDSVDAADWVVYAVTLNFTTKRKYKENIKDVEKNLGGEKLVVKKNPDYTEEWRVKVDDEYVFIKRLVLDKEAKKIGIKEKLMITDYRYH